MNEADVWRLLERGGFRAVPVDDPPVGEVILEKYNGLQDPSGAGRLGRLLADVVRDSPPDCVLVWEDLEDIALGFMVARELDVPVKRVVNAEGLAVYEGELASGTRALIVSDAFRDASSLLAVQGLLDKHGAELVGGLAVVDSGRNFPVRVRTLVTFSGDDVSSDTR